MSDYIFNVVQLLQARSGASCEHRVVAPSEALGVDEVAGPVRGPVRLTRLETSILATGAFEAPVTQACARCLEPATSTVAFDLEEEYVPRLDPMTGLPPSPDDERSRLDDRHNVDLSAALAETVVASLPVKPLCASGCAGIADARRSPVSDSDATDPRWEPLRRMREAMFPDSSPSSG